MPSRNKTVATTDDVATYLESVAEPRRDDARRLVGLIKQVTGQEPVMWGSSIIGFGTCHYRYESGREGDSPQVGFAPRAGQLTLYLTGAMSDYQGLLARLGKHHSGKSCLHITRLGDVDEQALRAVVDRSYRAAGTTP